MFRKLCALRVTGARFIFPATNPGSTLGGPEFFKKGVIRQIFCGLNEENISHHATKIII